MKLYITILLFKQFIAIHGSALPVQNPFLGLIENFEEIALGAERIIEKYEDIVRGVPLDFRYNETRTDNFPSHGRPSAPGCPKSEEGIPYVYHGSPTQCHLAGQSGHCKPYEKLFVEMGSHHGICNCECFQNRQGLSINKMHFCSRGSDHFVFHPEYKKCFLLHEQGPCQANEWLERVEVDTFTGITYSVSCKPRACPAGQRPNIDSEGKRNVGDPCIDIIVGNAPNAASPNDCDEGDKKLDKIKICQKHSAGYFMTS